MILYGIIGILLISIIFRICTYSIKAAKHGYKIETEFVGYYLPNHIIDIYGFFKPIFKYTNRSGEEVFIKSNAIMYFPIYKKGEKVRIKCYDNYVTEITEKNEVYPSFFSKEKEEVIINRSIKFNILGLKSMIDIFIQVLIIAIIILFKNY